MIQLSSSFELNDHDFKEHLELYACLIFPLARGLLY